MTLQPNDCWNTGQEVWKSINDFMGEPFDPCPPNPSFNGLEVAWMPNTYINPPYSEVLKGQFIDKATKEFKDGYRFLWMFNYANSKDLWRCHLRSSAILIPEKRFRFLPGHPDLTVSSPRYDNIMILWGDPTGFKDAFKKWGKVYVE